jgi:uncharacterized protein YciI
MPTYLYTITATRPGFIHEEPTAEEARIMGVHFEYLKGLFEQGTVILFGPCTDRALGLCVYEAASDEEALAIKDGDPAVQAGVMLGEVHPFKISLWRDPAVARVARQ